MCVGANGDYCRGFVCGASARNIDIPARGVALLFITSLQDPVPLERVDACHERLWELEASTAWVMFSVTSFGAVVVL